MIPLSVRTHLKRAWFIARTAPGILVLALATGILSTLVWHQWQLGAVREEYQRRFAELSVARMRTDPRPVFTPLSALREPELRGKVFRIADLIEDGSTIRGRTFIDCDIYGPAILLPNPDTVSMRRNFFLSDVGMDGLFLRLDPAQRIADGVIGLEDSRVEGCRLVRIGIAGSPGALEVLRKGFGPSR